MNQAQATVIAAGVTCLAALLGVALGGVLFGNKVRGLEEAVKTSTELARDAGVALQSFKMELETLTEQVSATMVVASELRAKQDEGSAQQGPIEQVVGAVNNAGPREGFAQSWEKVAAKIEKIASDLGIDGRTRARYFRIPRHNWRDVVAALNVDGRLGQNAARIVEAADLWERFKRRMSAVTQRDFEQMEQLANAVGA